MAYVCSHCCIRQSDHYHVSVYAVLPWWQGDNQRPTAQPPTAGSVPGLVIPGKVATTVIL